MCNEQYALQFVYANPITSLMPREWIDVKRARLKASGLKICVIMVGYSLPLLRRVICNYWLLGADTSFVVLDKKAEECLAAFKSAARGLFNGIYGSPVSFVSSNCTASEVEAVISQGDYNLAVVVSGDGNALDGLTYVGGCIVSKPCYNASVSVSPLYALADSIYGRFDSASAHKNPPSEFTLASNLNAALSVRTKLQLIGLDLDLSGESLKSDLYASAYDLQLADNQRAQKQGGEFVDFLQRDSHGNALDTARNNLALYEHLRWNLFHLTNGWTPMPIEQVTSSKRKDEAQKTHACITTISGLERLREHQAELLALEGAFKDMPSARAAADTVCYDFDLMDALPLHLGRISASIKPLTRP